IAVQVVAKEERRPSVQQAMDRLGVTTTASLPDLVSTSDIVSLHVPSAPDTVGMVDAVFLGQMKPGAVLLNTSRGDVVDEQALATALDAHELRAGLDVYADEPATGKADWSTPLTQHPNVVGTHHIGASTEQAQQAVATGVVEVVQAFSEGRVINCVNLAPARLGSVTVSVRHLNRVGVLARVLFLLGRAQLNVAQMENRIFSGGEAAVASIDVAGSVDDTLLDALRQVPHVVGVSVTRLEPSQA
ncbi:MAG: phosphoglycerate dehydrogenase, partial [Nocardioidaceae bacterium]